jgi:glucose-fructose oxidoreductase
MKSLPIRKSAIAFSLCLLTCFTNKPANAQSTSAPVRVAIVGLVHGHVAGFLPQLPKHPEIQLVGVEEPDTTLAGKYQSKYHLDPKIFYTNISTMLERTHPQAILVYTAISDHRHAIEVAAAHGVDVMVEKPLATSLADALAIRQTARAHHIQVLVNYETTWYASNHQVYELLQQGKLGELRKVIVRDGHQGPKEIGVGPEFLSWLTDPRKNGAGALFDFGCYGVDLMTWMMHGETPQSVTAVTQTDKPNLYPHVDDDATIILRYPKAQAVIMASWNWTFDIKDMEVYGTKGTAFTQKSDHLLVRYAQNQPASLVASPAIAPPNDSSVHYLEAVLAGKLTPKGDPTALDTNVIVMQILDAARESARTGKTITLKPLPE